MTEKKTTAKSLVMKPLFKHRVEKPAKGKRSYNRKAKHKEKGFDSSSTPD